MGKELTHSVPFGSVPFANTRNGTDTFATKSPVNISDLTLMIHKVLSDSAVPSSSRQRCWPPAPCSAEQRKAGNGSQATCLHAASTARLSSSFLYIRSASRIYPRGPACLDARGIRNTSILTPREKETHPEGPRLSPSPTLNILGTVTCPCPALRAIPVSVGKAGLITGETFSRPRPSSGGSRLREAVRLCGGDRGLDRGPTAAPGPLPLAVSNNLCNRPCLRKEPSV